MLLKFKKTVALAEYHGKGEIDFVDGQQVKLPGEKAKYLLATFPNNFSEGQKEDPPEVTTPAETDPPEDTIPPGEEEKSHAAEATDPQKETGAESPKEGASSEQTAPAEE